MTDNRMHTITLMFASGGSYMLSFASEPQARKMYQHIAAAIDDDKPDVAVHDDFGLEGVIRVPDILCRQIGDVESILQGQIASEIVKARAQAEFQTRAMSDPKLRFLMPAAPAGNGRIIVPAPKQ